MIYRYHRGHHCKMLTALRKYRRPSALTHNHLLRRFSSTSSQIHDQSLNRIGPPPIQVLLTESAGRGVFATRKIEAGELIHTAKPFITHPTLSALASVCYLCLRKVEIRVDCVKGGSFCSDACRQQARVCILILIQNNWFFV